MKMDSKFGEDMEMEEMVEGKGHNNKQHYKMMSMEDVAKELEKDFGEEIEDSKKYLCMAHVADKAGNEHDCHYLTEMAKDEYTHAYFIHSFMEEHDLDVLEDLEVEFEELKNKMKKFF